MCMYVEWRALKFRVFSVTKTATIVSRPFFKQPYRIKVLYSFNRFCKNCNILGHIETYCAVRNYGEPPP